MLSPQMQFSSYGEFEQCLSIKSPIIKNSGNRIYGRYCQLQMESPFPSFQKYNRKFESQFRSSSTFEWFQNFIKRLNLENYLTKDLQIIKIVGELDRAFKGMTLQYGVCFPHTCTSLDIAWLFNKCK